MARASKATPSLDPARKQAVIYARVSSKEQEKEGFSIPAQLKLLKEYAATQGFAVVQEYVDVETAKQTGRTSFDEMRAGSSKSKNHAKNAVSCSSWFRTAPGRRGCSLQNYANPLI